MGKLSICVHQCRIFRTAGLESITPRVNIVVDDTYRFQTHRKKHTFWPTFNETFVVGNTHRLAVIEVTVCNVIETSGLLPGLSNLGLGGIASGRRSSSADGHHSEVKSLTESEVSTTTSVLSYRSTVPSMRGEDDEHLPVLGRCSISIQRLVQNEPKMRTFYLASPSMTTSDNALIGSPTGIAGMISITLESDTLGEVPTALMLNHTLEERYMKRLKRFFLCYDKGRLHSLDLLVAHVRDPTEVPITTGCSSGDRCGGRWSRRCDSSVHCVSPQASQRTSESEALTPSSVRRWESFEDLMSRLEMEYGVPEPAPYCVRVRVDGCVGLDKQILNTSMVGSDAVYVVLRTESEDFVTRAERLSSAPVWSEANEAVLDVVNPDTFAIQVLVLGKGMSKDYEIGRTRVSVGALALDYESPRSMFLCTFDHILRPTVTGVCRFSLKPINFGLTSVEEVAYVDKFYDRLGHYFRLYDPMRIPEVDMLVHGRLGALDEFMNDLVVVHGREPGSARLLVTVQQLLSLRESEDEEMDNKEVRVIITMGSAVIRTKERRVTRFAPVVFDESHTIDVVRETDIIRVEVVKASDDSVVYGRVDFTCLDTQKGVNNSRQLHLIGNAGTNKAFFSGSLTVTLYSATLGHNYEVDTLLLHMYKGRLLRYLHRRVPESLHRVDIAVATVHDLEGLIAQLVDQHGEEGPTMGIYMTIVGCRQLKSRLGGVSPYVICRVGFTAHVTQVVKDNAEPDFFEFCDFCFDGSEDAEAVLIVMDRSDLGQDRELGRAVIPLNNVNDAHHYHVWLPLELTSKKGKKVVTGIIGVSYVVKDRKLIDNYRMRLMHLEAGRQSANNITDYLLEDSRVSNETPEPSRTVWGFSWTDAKRRVINKAVGRFMPARVDNRPSSYAGSLRSGRTSHEHLPRSTLKGTGRPVFNLMDAGANGVEEFFPVPLPSVLSSPLSTANDLNSSFYYHSSPEVFQQPSIALGNANSASPSSAKRLHVRVLYCKDLMQIGKRPPNPYLLLCTARESHRTWMEFGTVNPRYNEIYTFETDDPASDSLHITVLSDTPYGARVLGRCVLSLRNVQRGVPHTRTVVLVADSNRATPLEQGTLCLSLKGENFGQAFLPSLDAENRLRERMREYLLRVAPQDLHRLEWYVLEYAHGGNHALRPTSEFCGASKTLHESADVELGILLIKNLHDEGIGLGGTCVVQLKMNGSTCAKTRKVSGNHGLFRINEYCRLTVPKAMSTPLRLTVMVNGKKTIKAGECYLSFADLHRGVRQERTHVLVQHTRSGNPRPSGYITVSLLSTNFGSLVDPPTEAEEAQYVRLRNYHFYYLRKELATTAVTYATILNMEAHLQRLVEKHGPEPGRYHVKLTVVRLELASSAKSQLNLFCLVRIGLESSRSPILQGDSTFVFNEVFNMPVGLPEMDTAEFILVQFFPSKLVEVGRTQVRLRSLQMGKKMSLRLPIVKHAGTRFTEVTGALDVDLFAVDFGTSHDSGHPAISFDPAEDDRTHHTYGGGLSLSRVQSFAMDIPHVIVQGGAQSQHDCQKVATNGSETTGKAASVRGIPGQAIRVTILGFEGISLPGKVVYIRVTRRGMPLLRTDPLPSETLGSMNEVFELHDVHTVEDVILTLKVGVKNMIGSSSLACSDFCLLQCRQGEESEKRIRIYDETYRFIGICRMLVNMPRLSINMPKWFSLDTHVVEAVMDDVASVMAKYSPKDLYRIDLSVYRSTDIRRLHHALRLQLAPNVIATVYVAVHSVELLTETHSDYAITATVGEYSDEVCKLSPATPRQKPIGMPAQVSRALKFPLIRADVALAGPECIMSLSVMEVVRKSRRREVGRASVSLRALLTPQVYDMREQVSVSLVRVRRASNGAYAQLVGKITFSLHSPAFESYPNSVRFPLSAVSDFNQTYVRYYVDRICCLLRHYDANSLADIHIVVYESFVSNRTWEKGLPDFLSALIMRWGPEQDVAGPVPILARQSSVPKQSSVTSV